MPQTVNPKAIILAYLPHIVAWSLIALLVGPHLSSGEFWWTDEARHAMGGIFILDLIRDLPLADPMAYALRYFGQYPALSLNWHPPFFYLVEAGAYLLFGQHEAIARGTVLAFCLVGVSAWISWARRIWGTGVALLSAALFLSVPEWTLWARSVMLDVPAVAMSILAVLCFERYLQQPSYRRSVACGVVLACGLLLKHTVVFVVGALVIYGLVSERRRAMFLRQAIPAYVLTAAAFALLALHAFKFGGLLVAAAIGDQHAAGGLAPARTSLERLLVHPTALWKTWGWLLPLSAVGAMLPSRPREPQLVLVYAWIASWYVVGTLVLGHPGDALRYALYVMPPLALLAARPLLISSEAAPVRIGLVALLVGLLGANVWKSTASPARATSGYAAIAEATIESGTGAPIMYAGKYDGNFIFNLRARDNRRRHVVLRGDKTLVSFAVGRQFGVKSYVDRSSDIVDLIRRYGVEFVLIERPDVVGLREFGLLDETLKGQEFEHVASMKVTATRGVESPSTVEIFRFREYQPTAEAEVVIPLPHLGREIRFKPPPAAPRP